MERITVTVERRRWLRGEGSTPSRLLRSTDGKMCCLGFACLALGKTEDEIRDRKSPLSRNIVTPDDRIVENSRAPGFDTCLIEIDHRGPQHRDETTKAMSVNDETGLDDPFREGRLTALLEPLGIDLVFVD